MQRRLRIPPEALEGFLMKLGRRPMKEMRMDHYDLDSLTRALDMFEERYDLSSDKFFEAHRADGPLVDSVPGFHRHLWASFYLDVQRLRASSPTEFVAGVERALEAA